MLKHMNISHKIVNAEKLQYLRNTNIVYNKTEYSCVSNQ